MLLFTLHRFSCSEEVCNSLYSLKFVIAEHQLVFLFICLFILFLVLCDHHENYVDFVENLFFQDFYQPNDMLFFLF